MAGLKIKCPFCGNTTRIRSSERPTLLSVKAYITCPSCGELKAEFVGELINVRKAIFIDCNEVHLWDKPEQELMKEGKLQPKED